MSRAWWIRFLVVAAVAAGVSPLLGDAQSGRTAASGTQATMDIPTDGYVGAIYDTSLAEPRTCSPGSHLGVDFWTARGDPTNGGVSEGNPVFLAYPGKLVARVTDSRGAASGLAFFHSDLGLYTLYLGMADEATGTTYVNPGLIVDDEYPRGQLLGHQGNRVWNAGDPVVVRLHFVVAPLPSPDFGIDPSAYLGLQLNGCTDGPVPLMFAVMAGSVPDAPTPLLPADGTLLATPQITFTWTPPAATNIDRILLRVALAGDQLAGGPWVAEQSLTTDTLSSVVTLPGDGTYYWSLWSCRGCSAGTPVLSAPSPARRVVMSTNLPPYAPTLLSPGDHTAIRNDLPPDLSWQSNGDPEADDVEFYVELTGPSSWSSGWIAATTVTPTGLPRGAYVWKVRARDTHDNPSGWTDEWHFTLEGPPSAPTNLLVTGHTPVAISLAWTDNSNAAFDQESQFVVYRNGSEAGRVGPNVTTWTDEGIACDSPFTYTVRAFQASNGFSAPSNVASARTDRCDACGDPYEPNGTFAQATQLPLGSDVSSFICSATDQDYWRIDVPSPHAVIVVDLHDLPAGRDYDLTLYGPGRTEIAASRRSGTQSEHIEVSVYQSGSYYVRVVGFGGSFSNLVPYRLRANAELGNHAPAVGTVNPSSGSSKAMDLAMFDATYRDDDGWQDLRLLYFVVRPTSGPISNKVYIAYNGVFKRLYLRNDAGTAWLGGIAPGAPGSAENSQVIIDFGSCQATGAGTTFTLRLALRFKYSMEGSWNILLLTADASGAVDGLTKKGTWNVTVVNDPPVVGPIGPTGGFVPPDIPIRFSSVISDPDGYDNIAITYMLVVSSTGSAANGVYLAYNRTMNRIMLRNDNNTAWLGGKSPGTNGIVENSRARLNIGDCIVQGAGNVLTVTYSLQFKPAFSGDKVLYALGLDLPGKNTGLVRCATWTVGDVPFIEAEVGEILAPMANGSDPLASAGQYVYAPLGTALGDGSVTLQVQVYTMGHYQLEARVWAANYTSDSFLITVDNTAEIQWSMSGARNDWHWEGPAQQFGLIPGLHTIRLRTREAGARLDAVRLLLVP